VEQRNGFIAAAQTEQEGRTDGAFIHREIRFHGPPMKTNRLIIVPSNNLSTSAKSDSPR